MFLFYNKPRMSDSCGNRKYSPASRFLQPGDQKTCNPLLRWIE